MNKQIGNVTAAEMLAELDALPVEPRPAPVLDDARTIKEWAEKWDIYRAVASKEVAKGLKAGLFEKVRRKRLQVNDRTTTVVCYRWIGKSKK